MLRFFRSFKGYGEIIRCTKCGYVFKSEKFGNICPNCSHRNG